MTRPQTAQDVFEALGRDRLVEPARLAAFAERHARDEPSAALARLVADGLLTRFQAAEVANGNGPALWLGNYRVLDRLGRGGMGSVFLAEHAVLGKRVAVKVLSDALRSDPGARKRFTREARAAAALAHPNIASFLDADMAHDPPFLVMEYVDGVSLQEAVARGGALAGGEAAAVGAQVADGLSRAAAVGLVHRDIKPANLLIDRRGTVKILDLGIVKFTQDGAHSLSHGAEVILGTLDYLAPEQAIDSSDVDARADLYALGATLYFLLTGHPPFPGSDVRWKLRAKQTNDPHPLDQLRPDVEPELAAAVHRLLARDRNDRFPTPAAAAAALRPWARTGPEFPHRLFRFAEQSTAHDRDPGAAGAESEADRDPLPDTLQIVKARPRERAAVAPPAPAPTGAPTGSGEAKAPLPLPLPAPEPGPGAAFEFGDAPAHPTRRPGAGGRAYLLGLVAALAAVLAGVVALALALAAGR